MKKQKNNVYAKIANYLLTNEICAIECESKYLPDFMVIIEGKIIWIEINKKGKLEDFSTEMLENGCVYIIADGFQQFERTFISYVLSEKIKEKINE